MQRSGIERLRLQDLLALLRHGLTEADDLTDLAFRVEDQQVVAVDRDVPSGLRAALGLQVVEPEDEALVASGGGDVHDVVHHLILLQAQRMSDCHIEPK